LPKPTPLFSPEPEGRVLFYPLDTSEQATNLGGALTLAAIPFLLLLPLAVGALIFFYPMAWITCKLNGWPFTFDFEKLCKILDQDPYLLPTKSQQ